MKVYITHGLYDLVTPYFSTERIIEHMKLESSQRDRLTVRHFSGGHMFYAWEESRREFAASMRETLPGVPGLVGARLLRPQYEGGAYMAIMDFTGEEAFTDWTRSAAFRAAHGPSTGQTGQAGGEGEVETFETVASTGA